jgi:hypothetical protein
MALRTSHFGHRPHCDVAFPLSQRPLGSANRIFLFGGRRDIERARTRGSDRSWTYSTICYIPAPSFRILFITSAIRGGCMGTNPANPNKDIGAGCIVANRYPSQWLIGAAQTAARVRRDAKRPPTSIADTATLCYIYQDSPERESKMLYFDRRRTRYPLRCDGLEPNTDIFSSEIYVFKRGE